MIRASSKRPISSFDTAGIDVLVYGLGYEARSTALAAHAKCAVFAVRMEGPSIHALERNTKFAKTGKHVEFAEDLADLKAALATKIGRSERFRIGFDISSFNRAILFDLLVFFANTLRTQDALTCLYVPARFERPDPRFPQIESLGPSSRFFSGFQGDPTLPLCLVLGAGYEAGISRGIISQLEPRKTYCFWGSGNDVRFDRVVARVNLDLTFPAFDVTTIEYPLHDPLSSFGMLESLTYGMLRDFRVIIAPMGPKIFSLLAALVAMEHFGMVAVWRVKHSRVAPAASAAAGDFISIDVDTASLLGFASAQAELLQAA